MSYLHVRMFGVSVTLVYQALPMAISSQESIQCDAEHFHLAVSGVARFLVLPEEHRIVIEKASPDVPDALIQPWLYGTVIAYYMMYHDYLVLHGSAVLMHGKAVIFSGASGAGKSTLASALQQQGYPLITDDVVVIKRNTEGQYGILPGPAQSRLWADSLEHLSYNRHNAVPVASKLDKYAIPATQHCDVPFVPIHAFYELGISQGATAIQYEHLCSAQALKTLMQNVYRYFMLKPLGKTRVFFHDCTELSQQISVYKLTRTTHFHDLSSMISCIVSHQGEPA